jgi:hypothetical protein
MRIRLFIACTLCTAMALADGPKVLAQQAASPATIWNFLGIPQGMHKIRDATVNRRGNFPGLERKPPLKSIADPSNLESGVPAMEAAAKIKQAEDLKMQKIKAIKYLASIGCGCYDKDKTITNAMLASLEDCTEEVRLAAVEAIITAAEGKACGNCHSNCCCGKELVEKLSEIAYERDDSGCFIEPSERVRQAAIRALAVCCPSRQPLEIVEALPDDEGFSEEDMPGAPEDQLRSDEGLLPADPGTSAPIVPFSPSPSDAVRTHAPQQFSRDHEARVMPPSSRRSFQGDFASQSRAAGSAPIIQRAPFQWVAEEPRMGQPARQEATGPVSSRRGAGNARAASYSGPAVNEGSSQSAGAPSVVSAVRGTIEGIDARRGWVMIRLRDDRELPVGSQVQVLAKQSASPSSAARLEVIESRPRVLLARPLDGGRLARLAPGDEVVGW